MNNSVRISQQTSQSQPGSWIQAIKVLASTDAERITATDTYFQRITFFGYKALTGNTATNNTDSISVGVGSTYLPWAIAAGEELNITAPVGQKLNLADFYLKGTSGDGVFYVAL